jgi:hypothetical protein
MRKRNAGLVSIARSAISTPELEAALRAPLLVETEKSVDFSTESLGGDTHGAPV